MSSVVFSGWARVTRNDADELVRVEVWQPREGSHPCYYNLMLPGWEAYADQLRQEAAEEPEEPEEPAQEPQEREDR